MDGFRWWMEYTTISLHFKCVYFRLFWVVGSFYTAHDYSSSTTGRVFENPFESHECTHDDLEEETSTLLWLCAVAVYRKFQCWCTIWSILLIISYPLRTLVKSWALQRTRLLCMFFQPPVQRHRIFESVMPVLFDSPNKNPLRKSRRKPLLAVWIFANVVYSKKMRMNEKNGVLWVWKIWQIHVIVLVDCKIHR